MNATSLAALEAGRKPCVNGCKCKKHVNKHAILDLPNCCCIAHYVYEKGVRATRIDDKRHTPSTEKMLELQKNRKLWWESLSNEKQHAIQSAASKFANKVRWAKPGAKQRASDANIKTRARRSWHSYSGRQASGGGFRSDITIAVRSSWEANYARYLNLRLKYNKISGWRYEPKIFIFPPNYQYVLLNDALFYYI